MGTRPIWDDAFSEYAMKLARGDADAFGCLFFPERAICLALFELGRTYADIRNYPQIGAAALMNAVCQEFPAYAVKYNLMEQAGGDSPLARMLSDGGQGASADSVIRLTPEAGTAFLSF